MTFSMHLLCQRLSQIAAFSIFICQETFCFCWKRFVLRRSVWYWNNNIVTAERTDPNTTDTRTHARSLTCSLTHSLALSLSLTLVILLTWVYVKPLTTSRNESYVLPHLSPCTWNVFTPFVLRQQPARVKLIDTFSLIVVCLTTFLQVLKLMTVTCRSVVIWSHAWWQVKLKHSRHGPLDN